MISVILGHLNFSFSDILDDSRQQLYTHCSHSNSAGISCCNPVPKYVDPLLCGDHWYQAPLSVPRNDEETDPESDGELNDKKSRIIKE